MDSVLIQDIHMHIPDTDIYIYAGDICKVPKLGAGNFTAFYGWYTPKNSTPVYGWFFISETGEDVYPIRFLYFDGIEIVEHHAPSGGFGVLPYAPATQYLEGMIVYKTTGELYQVVSNFTSSDTGDPDADFAADLAAGKFIGLYDMHIDDAMSDTSENAVQNKVVYNYINTAVSTNTAFFIGTFTSLSDLEAYSGEVSNNDYAFVVSEYMLLTSQPADWSTNYTAYYTKSVVAPTWAANKYYSKSGDTYTLTVSEPANWSTNYADYYTVFNVNSYRNVVGLDTYSAITGGSAPTWTANTYYQGGNILYNRYKYNVNTDTWEYEYTLNNTPFTPAQIATINSGITSTDKTKLDSLPTAAIMSETAYSQLVTKDKDIYFTYD